MNKKFIAAVCICFCALMAIAGSSYYIKEGQDKSEINLGNETNKSADISEENAAMEVQNDVEKASDRISDVEEDASSFTGNIVDVGSNKIGGEDESDSLEEADNGIVEETSETESQTTREFLEENPIDGNGSDFSTEVNAAINSLQFSKESEMLWPVQGNIILEYNMDNTIYFSTLDEYKTNPAIIIQGKEYAPIVAAAKGVVTELSDNEELGVYMKMAIGNGYEVTYGQIVNPTVEVGETVEAGETIACVNKPTRYYEKEGYNLYFSVTKDGNPVDPMDFLILSE